MNQPNSGGPAFPVPTAFIPAAPGSDSLFVNTDEYGCGPQPGMSLRDWFAGQALAGKMANPAYDSAPDSVIAESAFNQADAMLAEREKGRTS